MRLIAYARVSTADQQTIENQVEKIQAYCDLHDHELVEVFQDQGVSAKDTDRPGLKRALRSATSKEVDGLVITKLDRLSRSIRDWDEICSTFNRREKALLSVYDFIDTSTAKGRMVINLFATIAQWEREEISERTKTSMDYLRRQGRRIVLHARYGYKINPENTSIVIPCSEEQGVLAKIQDLSNEGLSYAAIADRLNECGHSNRAGNPFSKAGVWRLVKGLKHNV